MIFEVAGKDFYNNLIASQYSPEKYTEKEIGAPAINSLNWEKASYDCKAPMNQLIERYGIENKTIFSVGSGRAHEEFWLWKNGNKLTLIDLCENIDSIDVKNFLETLPNSSSNGALNYYVGSYDTFLNETKVTDLYDVCYISGFAPDEHRREEIQIEYKARKTQSENEKFPWVTWPAGEKPFSKMIIDSHKALRNGGLFISQSYKGGVDIVQNPHFLQLMKAQLKEVGIQLLEVHYFRLSPAIILVVGIKGSEQEANEYKEWLRDRPSIKTFHGRYPYVDFKTQVSTRSEFGELTMMQRFQNLMGKLWS